MNPRKGSECIEGSQGDNSSKKSNPSHAVWVVLGGGRQAGIVVREGPQVSSLKLEVRFSTGALYMTATAANYMCFGNSQR